MLECPLYNPINDQFLSLFENVVLKRIWSFFQLDHRSDNSLYIMEATALHHCGELTDLKPP